MTARSCQDCAVRIDQLERQLRRLRERMDIPTAEDDAFEFQELMDHTARTQDFGRLNAWIERKVEREAS